MSHYRLQSEGEGAWGRHMLPSLPPRASLLTVTGRVSLPLLESRLPRLGLTLHCSFWEESGIFLGSTLYIIYGRKSNILVFRFTGYSQWNRPAHTLIPSGSISLCWPWARTHSTGSVPGLLGRVQPGNAPGGWRTQIHKTDVAFTTAFPWYNGHT